MGTPAGSHKTAKGVCKLMYSTLCYAIKAHARLHATVRSWRPANEDRDLSNKILKRLEESVARLVSGKTLVKQAFKIFSSKKLDENKWQAFARFWNQVSSYLNEDKNQVVERVVDLMREEIKHIWQFQGLFHLCQMFPPRTENVRIREYQRMQLLWRYLRFLTNFTAVSYLFLDVLPQLLPPNLFFSNADAACFFISQYFEPIVLKGKGFEYPYLYGLACNFVDIGIMCHKSKLQFSNPQEAELAAMQRSGLYALSIRERFNISVLSRVKVVPERFNAYSVALGNRMLTGQWATFFKRYHVLLLYDSLMTDAVRQVKSVYIEMRRIVYYNFLRIFSMQELPREIQKMMKSGAHLYFNDCIELLKLCLKSIEKVKKDDVDLEYETRQAYRKVHVTYIALCSALPGICKEVVVEFIRKLYIEMRANLPQETANYIIDFAVTCARRGCNAMMYKKARGYFERGIHTFMCMCSELDTAVNECRDSTLVVLEGRARASEILRNYFVSAVNQVPQLQQQGVPEEAKIMLRLLPLNDELRKAIASEVGAIFVGSEPEITPGVAPKKSFYPRNIIDMKSYVPPQEDILTKEQLNLYFKIHSKFMY